MEHILYVIKYDSFGVAYIQEIKYTTHEERYEMTKNDSFYGVYEDLEKAQKKQYELNSL